MFKQSRVTVFDKCVVLVFALQKSYKILRNPELNMK